MFNQNTFKKFRKNRASNNVALINFFDDKSEYLKVEIVIGYCKCHGCIILFSNFDGL